MYVDTLLFTLYLNNVSLVKMINIYIEFKFITSSQYDHIFDDNQEYIRRFFKMRKTS